MRGGFRGSLAARRAGAVLLSLFVLGYLFGITYWRFGEPSSQRSLLALGGLWAIGIVAIALLARAWRRG